MKKKAGLLATLMVLVLIAAACGGNGKEVSLGVTESGSYTNDYFGVSLSFPTEWEYQDADQMKALMEAGMEVASGDKTDLSKTKTLNLLMASEVPFDSGETGASVIAIAEKVSLLQGVKDGEDYLESAKKLMEENGLPYEFEEITTVNVGGKDLSLMKASINNGVAVVSQEYYSAIIEGYALNFIFTYYDDASKAAVDQIVQSISFK